MISNYILEWDLSKEFLKQESMEDNRRKLYEALIPRLTGSFQFTINGINRHDKDTSLFSFNKETDWMFNPDETTFHSFYGFDVEKLALVLIFKDKSQGIEIKNNHLYCFPYWMTYKFMSEEDRKQQLIKMNFMTDSRVWNKIESVYW